MKHFLLLIPFLLTACGTGGIENSTLGKAAVAGGAAYAAHEISDGDPIITGVTAAGALIATEALENASTSRARRVGRAQYNIGRSDAAKELYWAKRRIHEQQNSQPQALPVTLYPVPAPANPNPDAETVPSTILIPVVE